MTLHSIHTLIDKQRIVVIDLVKFLLSFDAMTLVSRSDLEPLMCDLLNVGQEKQVVVYRLVTLDTCEEHILKMALEKKTAH
jgi:hypothetical protein